MRIAKTIVVVLAAAATLSPGSTLGQARDLRVVARDTDLYEGGHPDEGGRPILDARGDPVFLPKDTEVVTIFSCGDEWCQLSDTTWIWGGDLCPFTVPATTC
jgi:hypothetical protein